MTKHEDMLSEVRKEAYLMRFSKSDKSSSENFFLDGVHFLTKLPNDDEGSDQEQDIEYNAEPGQYAADSGLSEPVDSGTAEDGPISLSPLPTPSLPVISTSTDKWSPTQFLQNRTHCDSDQTE